MVSAAAEAQMAVFRRSHLCFDAPRFLKYLSLYVNYLNHCGMVGDIVYPILNFMTGRKREAVAVGVRHTGTNIDSRKEEELDYPKKQKQKLPLVYVCVYLFTVLGTNQIKLC